MSRISIFWRACVGLAAIAILCASAASSPISAVHKQQHALQPVGDEEEAFPSDDIDGLLNSFSPSSFSSSTPPSGVFSPLSSSSSSSSSSGSDQESLFESDNLLEISYTNYPREITLRSHHRHDRIPRDVGENAIPNFLESLESVATAPQASPPSKPSTIKPQNIATVIERNESIEKGKLDNRAYRVITLSNGLKAILVSDPRARKAAAAVDVGAGAGRDPKNIPGLAHFTEHMLFLGTEQFPEESEYSDFIEEHGGFSNAYTSYENTNFFFDVSPAYFEQSLKRFASFFSAPLFTESATSRELHAIDSEHAKNLLDDSFRLDRMRHEVAQKTHYYNKFATGNFEILHSLQAAQLRQALLKHYHEYYTADLLNIAILGREDLNTLESYVTRFFSSVPIRPSQSPTRVPLSENLPLYSDDILGSKILIQPVKHGYLLSLSFVLPSQFNQYREKSLEYVAILLNAVHRGSLSFLLQREGYAAGISAEIDTSTHTFLLFNINIALSRYGYMRMEKVMRMFWEYMHVIRDSGISEWRYDELRSISRVQFDYSDVSESSSYVSELAHRLHMYPPKDVLSGPYLYDHYDEALIQELFKVLVPRNMVTFIVADHHKSLLTQTEKYYGIQYGIEKWDLNKLELWELIEDEEDKFQLPRPNSYIPQNLSLVKESKSEKFKSPVIVHEAYAPHSTRVWYAPDTEFYTPKVNVAFRLWSPLVHASPTATLLTHLYLSLALIEMSSSLYQQRMAGYSVKFKATIQGIDIVASGYSSDIQRFTRDSMKILGYDGEHHYEYVNDKIFEQIKAEFLMNLMSARMGKPVMWGVLLSQSVLHPSGYLPIQLITALLPLTLNDVLQWRHILFSDTALEVLCHGNSKISDCLSITSTFEKQLPFNTSSTGYWSNLLRVSAVPFPRISSLQEPLLLITASPNKLDSNSAIYTYFQFGIGTRLSVLCSQLFSLIAARPVYTNLRTKQQLGYIVFGSYENHGDISGYRILVQSHNHDTSALYKSVMDISSKLDHIIKTLDVKTLKIWLNTLIELKSERPTSLSHQTVRYYEQIANQQYEFDRAQKDVELLKQDPNLLLKLLKRYSTLLLGTNMHGKGGNYLSILIESSKRLTHMKLDEKANEIVGGSSKNVNGPPVSTLSSSSDVRGNHMSSGSASGNVVGGKAMAMHDEEVDDTLDGNHAMFAELDDLLGFGAPPLDALSLNTNIDDASSSPFSSFSLLESSNSASTLKNRGKSKSQQVELDDLIIAVTADGRGIHTVPLTVSLLHTLTDSMPLWPSQTPKPVPKPLAPMQQ